MHGELFTCHLARGSVPAAVTGQGIKRPRAGDPQVGANETTAVVLAVEARVQGPSATSVFYFNIIFHRIAERMRLRAEGDVLKVGMVGINFFAMASSEAPFGGTNPSGMGREGGIEGIRDCRSVNSSQMVWA